MASVHVPMFMDMRPWTNYRGAAFVDGTLGYFLGVAGGLSWSSVWQLPWLKRITKSSRLAWIQALVRTDGPDPCETLNECDNAAPGDGSTAEPGHLDSARPSQHRGAVHLDTCSSTSLIHEDITPKLILNPVTHMRDFGLLRGLGFLSLEGAELLFSRGMLDAAEMEQGGCFGFLPPEKTSHEGRRPS